jgi:hypothetical protein
VALLLYANEVVSSDALVRPALFTGAARRLGLGLAGDATWAAEAVSYAGLADRVARFRSGCGLALRLRSTGGRRVLKELRARLPPAGRRFLAAFQARGHVRDVSPFAVYAAQAADALLGAIARSDGNLASVTKELLATRVRDGIVRSFEFERNGDTTTQQITILRPLRNGGTNDVHSLAGTKLVRAITVRPRLLR